MCNLKYVITFSLNNNEQNLTFKKRRFTDNEKLDDDFFGRRDGLRSSSICSIRINS